MLPTPTLASFGVLLVWLSTAAAADTSNDSIVRGMADMFSLMARQMGNATSQSTMPAPQGMQGWPSAFNPQQMMPAWGQMPLSNNRMWPGASDLATRLQGYWLGANGERLGFWQNRFQLQSPQGQSQGGQFTFQGERVLLFEANGVVQPFEYAQQDDRMALRNPQGQVFLYRRAPGSPWGGGL